MDYLARVDLHGARTEEDYVQLHAELAKSQFYFVIMGSDGVTAFRLPAGTYYCYATYPDINAAHTAVASAVGRTPFTASIFAVAATAWQSNDLQALPT